MKKLLLVVLLLFSTLSCTTECCTEITNVTYHTDYNTFEKTYYIVLENGAKILISKYDYDNSIYTIGSNYCF